MNIIKCKDCKYFYKDIWEIIDGQPKITKHNECSKWNNCQTDPEGFCHKGKQYNK